MDNINHITDLVKAAREGATNIQELFAFLRANPHDIPNGNDLWGDITLALESIGIAINHMANTEEGEEFFDELANQLTGHALGHILLAAKITDSPGGVDRDARPNGHLAVDVSDVLGPDWAQAWYRFIVLVTKLA